MTRQALYLANRRGVVLVAVLWIVAALSVLVMGMIHSVRIEVQQVSEVNQKAQGNAWGAAAIAIVLQGMSPAVGNPSSWVSQEVRFQGLKVPVRAMSINGFIDLNVASPALLEKLFQFAGGLSAAEAVALAEVVKVERDRLAPRGRFRPFQSAEDLLRLPQIDYDIYAKLADLVTTDSRGSGRVNAQAAPLGVLRVLTDGNLELATRIHQAREAGAVGVDTSAMNPDLVDNVSSRRYLMQARVPLSDGRSLVVSRWVDINSGRSDGLPWRIFHAESRIESAPSL